MKRTRALLATLLTLVALSIAIFSAAPASAETDFPYFGHYNSNVRIAKCAPGSFMVGFQGRFGDVIDQITVRCAPVLATAFQHGTAVPANHGGGFGGSAFGAHDCPPSQVVGGIAWQATRSEDDASQPGGVDMFGVTCRELAPPYNRGGFLKQYSNDDVGSFTNAWMRQQHEFDPPGYNFDNVSKPAYLTDAVPPHSYGQQCPADELSIGLKFLSGVYVDGVALMCDKAPTALAGPPPPAAAPPGALAGFDRPGSDLKRVDLTSNNPNLCFNACQGNALCQGWTFVAATGVQGPICFLKRPAPKLVANPCCVSGVKIPSDFQIGLNFPGNDITHFTPPTPDPAECQNACLGSAQCVAWTYVKGGVQGAQPVCYLKSKAANTRKDDCCISGLKPAGTVSGANTVPKPGAGIDFSGNWKTVDGSGNVFMMTLTQDAAGYVRGTYTGGTIDTGAVVGSQLWATWHEGANSGRLLFTIYGGNTGFSGRYNNDVNADPKIKDKKWDGTRVAAGGGTAGGGGAAGGAGGGGAAATAAAIFVGNWQTTINGSTPGTLILVPSGTTWKGNYNAFGISGQISQGSIGSDGHLRFKWSQPGAVGHGEFIPTGPTSFTGKFWFDANPGAIGTWDGHR